MALLKSLLLATLFLLLASPSAWTRDLGKEALVKAGYIFNFTKFATWPQPGDTLSICTFGKRAMSPALKAMHGQQAGGRRIAITESPAGRHVMNCQVAYLSGADARTSEAVLNVAGSHPILTVSDQPGFIDNGGIIGFMVEADRVRLEINLANASRTGIQLSPQLLGVAKRVVRER